jgi:hypothetical protein
MRSRDIQAIEVSLKPIVNIASNFILILGMACLVIDRERLKVQNSAGDIYDMPIILWKNLISLLPHCVKQK